SGPSSCTTSGSTTPSGFALIDSASSCRLFWSYVLRGFDSDSRIHAVGNASAYRDTSGVVFIEKFFPCSREPSAPTQLLPSTLSRPARAPGIESYRGTRSLLPEALLPPAPVIPSASPVTILRPGFVHDQRPAHEFFAVQLAHRALAIRGRVDLHERETARRARLPVPHQLHVRRVKASHRQEVFQVLSGRIEVDIRHKQFHSNLPKSKKKPRAKRSQERKTRGVLPHRTPGSQIPAPRRNLFLRRRRLVPQAQSDLMDHAVRVDAADVSRDFQPDTGLALGDHLLQLPQIRSLDFQVQHPLFSSFSKKWLTTSSPAQIRPAGMPDTRAPASRESAPPTRNFDTSDRAERSGPAPAPATARRRPGANRAGVGETTRAPAAPAPPRRPAPLGNACPRSPARAPLRLPSAASTSSRSHRSRHRTAAHPRHSPSTSSRSSGDSRRARMLIQPVDHAIPRLAIELRQVRAPEVLEHIPRDRFRRHTRGRLQRFDALQLLDRDWFFRHQDPRGIRKPGHDALRMRSISSSTTRSTSLTRTPSRRAVFTASRVSLTWRITRSGRLCAANAAGRPPEIADLSATSARTLLRTGGTGVF